MRRPFASTLLSSLALVLTVGCPLWPDPDPQPPSGDAPTIRILAPLPDTELFTAPDAARTVAIEFAVDGLALAPPGTCLSVDGPCGHVVVTVDAGACPGPVGPQNAAASSSPALASLRRCTSVAGTHAVRLALTADDGSPILGPNDAPIEASVSVTTALPPLRERLGGPDGIARIADAWWRGSSPIRGSAPTSATPPSTRASSRRA